MAPGASILLVEANTNYLSDLLAAVDYGAAPAGRIRRLHELGNQRVLARDAVGRILYHAGRASRGQLRDSRRRHRGPGQLAGDLAERPGCRRHFAQDARRRRRLSSETGWSFKQRRP